MNTTGPVLVIGPASRVLRRALRPIEWVVLEEVALDARRDDAGLLVAPTSARRVAEHVGLTPGAAARALASLVSAGLVTHARQSGPAGRFGLSAYALSSVPGLDVVEADQVPPVVPPRVARPAMDSPRVAERHMVGEVADAPGTVGGTTPTEPVPVPPRVTSRRRARPTPSITQLIILDDTDVPDHRPANGRP